jgi:glycerol-3-phosphate dehydrogenase
VSATPAGGPGDLIVDVAVFGAGVTGLWLCNRLLREGYRCLLVERDAVGGVQTLASQGIIHGGTKYALTGRLTGSSEAIREMPAMWKTCLEGRSLPDLRAVRVLSENQYLWAAPGLLSRATGFIASKVMQGRVARVDPGCLPEGFRGLGAGAELYRLDEPVLDTASLVETLARPLQKNLLIAKEATFEAGRVRIDGRTIRYRRLALAAGAGNRGLLAQLGLELPRMQLRPLHMVMARGELPALFGHCLGSSANPRATVTSYPLADGARVWYVGGDIAEQGVTRDRVAQIAHARSELRRLLPWVEFGGLQWATHRVFRAEPRMPARRRPDSFFLEAQGDVLTLWPTKLAFAPKLAEAVIAHLHDTGVVPVGETDCVLPRAIDRAALPWEEEVQWS